MGVLNNSFALIRIVIALGLAAFWGYLAIQWNDAGEFGPGKPTVIGVGALAILAGVSGLIGLVRLVQGGSARPTSRSAADDDPAPSDFDADAIIARHLANRPAPADPESGGSGDASPPPARPTFGRKQS